MMSVFNRAELKLIKILISGLDGDRRKIIESRFFIKPSPAWAYSKRDLFRRWIILNNSFLALRCFSVITILFVALAKNAWVRRFQQYPISVRLSVPAPDKSNVSPKIYDAVRRLGAGTADQAPSHTIINSVNDVLNDSRNYFKATKNNRVEVFDCSRKYLRIGVLRDDDLKD